MGKEVRLRYVAVDAVEAYVTSNSFSGTFLGNLHNGSHPSVTLNFSSCFLGNNPSTLPKINEPEIHIRCLVDLTLAGMRSSTIDHRLLLEAMIEGPGDGIQRNLRVVGVCQTDRKVALVLV